MTESDKIQSCSRYPVRKLIPEGDKIKEIFLYKYPVNGVPPKNNSTK